jgi:uncharacterized coiled-coil protein SlyX
MERRERRAEELEEALHVRSEAFDARERESEERLTRLEVDVERREEALEEAEAALAEQSERLARKEAELADYVRQVQGVLNRREAHRDDVAGQGDDDLWPAA